MLALGAPKEFVYLLRRETRGSDSVDFEEYVSLELAILDFSISLMEIKNFTSATETKMY